jgi:hypothetical protein
MSQDTNDIKQFWNDTPAVVKIAVYGVGAFVAYRIGKKFYDQYQLKQRLKQYQQQQIQYNVNTGTGPGVVQTVNLASVAGEVYDAFYNNDPFGWSEDETRAVNSVKTVPKPYIPQLEQTYNQLYQKDLRADLLSFLDSDEWSQISYLFN